MIRHDEVRSALTDPVPSRAFDTLVRRELGAGRKPSQVYDALAGLLPDIQDWPEYDGEGREDLQGTLDALQGWCHPGCRYVAVAVPARARADLGQWVLAHRVPLFAAALAATVVFYIRVTRPGLITTEDRLVPADYALAGVAMALLGAAYQLLGRQPRTAAAR